MFPTNDTCRLIAGSLRRLVKGDRPFGEGRAETNRIIRWTNQIKDKMNGDKGAVLKGPVVNYPIMGMCRKDKGIGSVGELKDHTFGGIPNDLRL